MGNVLFRKKDDHGGDGFYEGQDCLRSAQLSHEASYLEHSQLFIRMRREIAMNIFGVSWRGQKQNILTSRISCPEHRKGQKQVIFTSKISCPEHRKGQKQVVFISKLSCLDHTHMQRPQR